MFRIIQFNKLLRYVSVTTVMISVAIYSIVQYLNNDFDLYKIITISSFVSIILIFLLLSPVVSRKIWSVIGRFNKSLFPDLNGTWIGKVVTEENIEIEIRAVIRQSLLETQIDIHGKTVKSITLETTPTKIQGQNKLYYVYHSSPKDPSWASYNGSTLFDIRCVDEKEIELSGNYYTDRKSIGRIVLRQDGFDANKDVSYY